ncbi:hypothetical protein [Xanthobacter sediminis]
MSLAGQISHTVATLASTRETRHEALGRIRNDAARHLRDARAAQRRMASEQQHRLTGALRTIKLGTAILLGDADERIDRYRKARIKQALRIDRALAEGFRVLRGDTRKWISTQSAVRRKLNAQDLRQRRHDRIALSAAVHDLTTKNLAFLATLVRDRQEASTIWLGRGMSASMAPAARRGAPHARAEATRADGAARTGAVKAEAAGEPAKAHHPAAEAAKAEPAKMEPAKPEFPKGDGHFREAAKGDGFVAKAEVDVKSAAPKAAPEKPGPGKSV